MIKKISLLALILLFASCKNMSKKATPSDTSPDDQVIIEDKSIDQPYQSVNSAEEAKAINEGVIETIKEVEVQDRVFFDYNSFNITEAAKSILNTQIEWLKSSPNIKIMVEGHCDERGTREYNIALGEKRALSAKNYLINGGVEAARIQIISYGKERPAYFGSTEDSYAKNRRAVVVPQN